MSFMINPYRKGQSKPMAIRQGGNMIIYLTPQNEIFNPNRSATIGDTQLLVTNL